VRTNATPASIDDLNLMPVKFANGATILLKKDVAQVRDGSMVQQNIVRSDGRRSVLLSIIKNGNAPTLAVVNGVKQALQAVRARHPRDEDQRTVRPIRCSLPTRSTVCA
jgi:multidrug efflux pump subunit AcrB